MELTIRRVAAASAAIAAVARCAALTAALAMGVAMSVSSARAASADDAPAAVPYRPSVSTPAALSTPGWLEVEAGYLHDHEEAGARRDSVPLTLKLAFTPDWGVRVGTDAWVQRRDETGERATGSGDTSIILKRRFAVDEDSAFGLEAGVTLPTSRHGLNIGSGQPDWGLNAIYSADFGAWHTDLNVAATRFSGTESGTGRTQWLGAASLSRSIDERWTVLGELSGTVQHGADSSRQLLAAASYNVSKRVVIDAGAAHSLRRGVPVWSAFTGVTWLAARLF